MCLRVVLRTPTRLLFNLPHLAANARAGLRSGLVLMFIHLFMASLEIIALALGLPWPRGKQAQIYAWQQKLIRHQLTHANVFALIPPSPPFFFSFFREPACLLICKKKQKKPVSPEHQQRGTDSGSWAIFSYTEKKYEIRVDPRKALRR